MNHNLPESEFPAGVVTLLQWTMMADGSTYMHVWASRWRVVTNEMSGIPGLRTADRFHLIAISPTGETLVVLPGCQVKAWVRCDTNPSLRGGPQAYSAAEQTGGAA